MNKWLALSKGDIVDVVAPASPSSTQELNNAISYLKGLGLVPRVPKDILRPQIKFLAHSDEYRFKHLKKAIESKDSAAVWCLRGGYGCLRMIPFLKKIRPPKQAKVFIGLSDISVLHNFINFNWSWPSLHGPVLYRMPQKSCSKIEKKWIEEILFGQKKSLKFSGLVPLNKQARLSQGRLRSMVVGGNLKTLQSIVGTQTPFIGKNRIVFLEDVSERGYSVDRALTQLLFAKAFSGAKAIVFGDFVDHHEKNRTSTLAAVLSEFAASQSIPVLKGVKSGHGNLQLALPFGTKASLRLGSRGELTTESGCR